jgi:hypothetical protein
MKKSTNKDVKGRRDGAATSSNPARGYGDKKLEGPNRPAE